MPDKLSTPQEVAEMVESEGLGYAIDSYISAESIEPGPLREAWREAAQALKRVIALLPGMEDY